jgi:GTP cyclohydrolase I
MPTIKTLSTKKIKEDLLKKFPESFRGLKVYGVPSGGYHIATLLEFLGLAKQVDSIDTCDIVVDDLIDSGATAKRYTDQKKAFWALYQKKNTDVWLEFPWENKDNPHTDIVIRMLEAIGEDPKREGLIDTPKRVVKSWKELYSGYTKDPKEILGRVFTSDSKDMVICRDIEFYSACEHHIMPFFGKVNIGYIPGGKVVGLSKLARLVEVYARRLQIQENFNQQIADAIQTYVPKCQGVMVTVEAKHMCMCARGVSKQNSVMSTSAIRGRFTEPAVRAEFLSLIR